MEVELKEWIKRWYEKDFSWEALRNRPVQARVQVNEFDVPGLRQSGYWRINDPATQLISDREGRQYTKFHLPLYFMYVDQDGRTTFEPTEKAEWTEEQWEQLNCDFLTLLQGQHPPPDFQRTFDGLGVHEMDVYLATRQDCSGLSVKGEGFPTFPKFSYLHGPSYLAGQEEEYSDCYFEGAARSSSGQRLLVRGCVFQRGLAIERATLDQFSAIDCVFTHVSLQHSRIERLQIKSVVKSGWDCDFSGLSGQGADFRGAGLDFLRAFRGALPIQNLDYDRYPEKLELDKYFTKKLLRSAEDRYPKWHFRDRRPWEHWPGRDEAFSDLEISARYLKDAAAGASDHSLSQCWHRCELRARQENPRTDRGLRIISWWYDLLSNYGYSISKPLLWLVLFASLIFPLIYSAIPVATSGWLVEWFSPKAAEHYFEALGYSVQNVAPILTPNVPKEGPLLKALKDTKNASFALGAAVGIVQTAFSAGLVFLAALAARRRFRISE